MPYGPGSRVNLSEEQERALASQLKADPRVQEYLRTHRSITGKQLRDLFGYDVPDNANFLIPARLGNDPRAVGQGLINDGYASLGEKLVNIGAGAISAYGAGTLLNDAINGGGGASESAGYVNDTAPNISTPEGMANATAFGARNPVDSGFLPSATGTNQVTFQPSGGGGASGVPGSGPTGLTGVPGSGTSMLDRIMTGLKDYGPLALGGYSALQGLTQGATPAEQDLQRILKMAEGRITATEPLFNSLNRMVTAQLPTYARGEG